MNAPCPRKACRGFVPHARLRHWLGWLGVAPRHRHDFKRVGYGGAGWSLYECACGAKEIDA